MRLLALLLALCSTTTFALLIAPARATLARPRPPISMKSDEDREFEAWARKKKIASGVDPDEDFATGRQNEKGILQIGGSPPPALPRL